MLLVVRTTTAAVTRKKSLIIKWKHATLFLSKQIDNHLFLIFR